MEFSGSFQLSAKFSYSNNQPYKKNDTMVAQLLNIKISTPQLREDLVLRPQLTEQLNQALQRRLTLTKYNPDTTFADASAPGFLYSGDV